MRISDWSSDVCSSDRLRLGDPSLGPEDAVLALGVQQPCERPPAYWHACDVVDQPGDVLRLYAIIKAVEIVQALRLGRKAHQREQRSRSEEHTSELQSLMRISYAVLCFKKKIRET